MFTSPNSVGCAFVYATWIVSPPLAAYFAYGRSPGIKMRLWAADQDSERSAWIA
jgi:hypothetical protein